ncbi:TonB-linked outer membrane protein, SusC/RagA family [Maribacter sedimenticola]|uniref:TonB-linked outer membrane protein, SusC/RagA family n=1 Tax=Maribacter sedimenticola TaxID=228956 RepID=A0ABY1SD30_9FLAO|nr:TonB-dependent receptor [Maribacter sedimenticola]SNR27664.1 TonB-linked outer membrane protein, SusC/RagA family [Maribacter sedimenticola]
MKNLNRLNFKKTLFLCFFLISLGISAQEKTISGVITDNSGIPLPGVNIVIKGTNTGTSANFDGEYSIDASAGQTLVFSSIGYKPLELLIGANSTYDISMEEDSALLDEVVVVGYGTTKKSDVTGSIVSVSSEDINSRPVNNAIEAMQGKAAGVDISSNERPGSIGSITIRGQRSLSASNAPLYVLDGIPLISGGIDNINPTDIESIDILKDASATAIYGSRGANGVVIVTTKRGKSGRFTLSYNTAITTQTLNEAAPQFNAGEFVEYRRWAKYYENPDTFPRGDQPTIANDEAIFSGDDTAFNNILRGWEGGTWDGTKLITTDFTDFVTQTGFTNQHTLSASGGSEKMKAYGSFGYINNTGSVVGQSYERYNANVSVELTPTEWFTFGGNINTSYSTQEYGQSTSGNVGVSAQSGLYQSARSIFQYTLPYDSEGNRIEFPGGDIAVKTIINEVDYSQDQRVTLRAFASFYAQLDFGAFGSAWEGLKFRTNFGPDIETYRNGSYLDGQSVIRTGSSYAALRKRQRLSYTLDNLLLYNRTFGKHDLGATLLQSQTQFIEESNFMAADNIPFASQKWNALSADNVALSSYDSDLTERQLLSYMARLNYGFDNKYLLTVSGRYDGASQLAEGNKGAFFPSAALGWSIDQENFLADSNWIDQLKLRAGVGVTGNAAIDAYSTKGGLLPLFYPVGSTAVSGVQLDETLANQELGWEKTTQYNYGLDFSFFTGRVSGSMDYYTSNTTDLLLRKSIPSITGYINTFANVGETKSNGIDLTLNTVNVRTEDFQWSTDISASWQENEIVELANGKEDDINNNWFIGESLGVIYGYASNGIWQESDAAEIALFNANGHTFSPGNARPVDQNGDYVIDANNDRVIIGNTIPKYILGLTNTFKYKDLELSFFLFGRFGYTYNTGGEGLVGRYNSRKVDYYTPNNTDSEYQKPIYSAGFGDTYFGTLGYRSGSFIKVRNVSLGYNLPQKITSDIGLSKLRFYVQAQNPGFIFSKVDWIDLDVTRPANNSQGYSLGNSASNRGFTVGMNVEF